MNKNAKEKCHRLLVVIEKATAVTRDHGFLVEFFGEETRLILPTMNLTLLRKIKHTK